MNKNNISVIVIWISRCFCEGVKLMRKQSRWRLRKLRLLTYELGYRHGHADGYRDGYGDGVGHMTEYKRVKREENRPQPKSIC